MHELMTSLNSRPCDHDHLYFVLVLLLSLQYSTNLQVRWYDHIVNPNTNITAHSPSLPNIQQKIMYKSTNQRPKHHFLTPSRRTFVEVSVWVQMCAALNRSLHPLLLRLFRACVHPKSHSCGDKCFARHADLEAVFVLRQRNPRSARSERFRYHLFGCRAWLCILGRCWRWYHHYVK